jgi:predicted nucleotidyltransferase
MGSKDNHTTDQTRPHDLPDTSIKIPIPAGDSDIYRYSATDDLLTFLINRPFEEYTIRSLASIVDVTHRSVGQAVTTLANNDMVTVRHEGNRKLVSINRARTSTPGDSVLRIPQSEFHKPVRRAVDELTTEIDGVLGILVYGSVARGEADRQSDVDLWVLVDERRSRSQQRATDLARNLANTEIDGDRYTFHVVVESPESIPAHTEDIADIVSAGIPVYQTEEFEQFRSLMEGLVDE